jgi:hypothetical protein
VVRYQRVQELDGDVNSRNSDYVDVVLAATINRQRQRSHVVVIVGFFVFVVILKKRVIGVGTTSEKTVYVTLFEQKV